MIYFDTTYLAKCYLTDTGHEAVRRLAASADAIACCEIGRIELAAAAHRAWREERITKAMYQVIRQQVDEDERRNAWVWLPVTSALLKRTAKWMDSCGPKTFIRASDALHLACAAEHGFTDVYSSDRHLLAAAATFGLCGRNVIPPAVAS